MLDRSNTYHCDQPHCGEDCEFALQECRNAGCGKVFSRKWATKHDAVCPHKLLACERECGENVKRAHMREHLQLSCELRTVRCPCYDLGCKTGNSCGVLLVRVVINGTRPWLHVQRSWRAS